MTTGLTTRPGTGTGTGPGKLTAPNLGPALPMAYADHTTAL